MDPVVLCLVKLETALRRQYSGVSPCMTFQFQKAQIVSEGVNKLMNCMIIYVNI